MYGEDYMSTFAPVVKQVTFRTLLAVSGSKGYFVQHLDIKTAFLNGELNETVYMHQPEGFESDSKYVCKLIKAIYGLKQAARCWNLKLNDILVNDGFRMNNADNCLYMKFKDNIIIYILIYVDDLLVCSNYLYEIENVFHLLSKFFKVKDLGPIKNYLGIEVETDNEGIFHINQQNYIKEMLNTFELSNSKISNIPMDTGYYKNDQNSNIPFRDKKLYRKAIGSLLYMCTNSRPDITSSVIILSRKNENPLISDWNEVKRIYKYLKGTINEKLMLGSVQFKNELVGFSDADWASDSTDRKSTSGYIIQLSGSTIDWMSKKQSSVSLSSCESEYVALTEVCKQLMWVK